MAQSDDIRAVQHVEHGGAPLQAIGEEILDDRIHDDHGEPHKAALEDSNADGHVRAETWAALFFLSFTFVPALSFTLNAFLPVAPIVAMRLQGSLNNLNWIAGGFSLGGSVAFAIAGQLSDYLGRKQVVMSGQAFLLVGHLVGATAQTFGQLIGANVLLGIGTGIAFV